MKIMTLGGLDPRCDSAYLQGIGHIPGGLGATVGDGLAYLNTIVSRTYDAAVARGANLESEERLIAIEADAAEISAELQDLPVNAPLPIGARLRIATLDERSYWYARKFHRSRLVQVLGLVALGVGGYYLYQRYYA